MLRSWRGEKLRGDGREDAGGSLLDAVEALGEELGVAFVKLDVVLRGGSGFKPDGVTLQTTRPRLRSRGRASRFRCAARRDAAFRELARGRE